MAEAQSIPLVDMDAMNAPLFDKLIDAAASVIRSGNYIMGDVVTEFETQVAEWIGVSHAISMSSGTDALLAVLMAKGVGPGDEVIVPSFTFFATAGCVSRLGATPVFVDIEPESFNLDPRAVENAMTERTKAIIAVHLFGRPCDMTAISTIANANNVFLIEDAAQAIGASLNGVPVGAIGDSACFSFFPAKNLGAFGDGGLVTTNDDALADAIEIIRVHGSRPKYVHHVVGGNFRLDALQAALLSVKLPHLAGWQSARQKNARAYAEIFRVVRTVGRASLFAADR
ncbi:MAG: DegT/DnrJ/EryC1/StrS family aminotransferase [Polyangiales bacterium]